MSTSLSVGNHDSCLKHQQTVWKAQWVCLDYDGATWTWIVGSSIVPTNAGHRIRACREVLKHVSADTNESLQRQQHEETLRKG